MKSYIKSLFEASENRVRNPLLGAFLLYWLILNWKLWFTLLFSGEVIAGKIDIIENDYTSIWLNLVIPFGAAVLSTIGLPYIMMFLDKVGSLAIRTRKESQNKGKLHDIHLVQRIEREKLKLEKIKSSSDDLIELNNTIDNLDGKNKHLVERINNLEIDNNDLLKQINELNESRSQENKVKKSKFDPDF